MDSDGTDDWLISYQVAAWAGQINGIVVTQAVPGLRPAYRQTLKTFLEKGVPA